MATVGRSRPVKRVSPIKPGLRGARNWATAQVRAASYSAKGFWRLCLTVFILIAAVILGALWLGGFLPNAQQATSNFTKARLMSMGFVVDQIDVMGEGRLRERDVRAALGVYEGDFLFEMDVKAAQKRIESISWVDRAVVRRLWPDRIVVQVIERRPYALWQNDGNIHLIDQSGEVLQTAIPADYPQLRLVVGPSAAENLADIDQALQKFPNFASGIEIMMQRPSGRWDVRLSEGDVLIKLPKDNVTDAVATVIQLHNKTRILDREVAIIDVRLPDRISLTGKQDEHA